MSGFGPPPPLTTADFLDQGGLLDRNFEDHWIDGLLEDPTSRSVFEAFVAVALRLQAAGDTNIDLGGYILTSPGRAPGSSTVRIQRPSGPAGTIPENTRFQDQRGAAYRTTAETTVPSAATTQTLDLPVVTERAGYYLNTIDPPTFQILDSLFDASFVTVLGPDPVTGGTTPFLDQHGRERRVLRAPGEADTQYRQRILFLEDQVSPKAIADTVLAILSQQSLFEPIAEAIEKDGLAVMVEPFIDSGQSTQLGLVGADKLFAAGSVGAGDGYFFDDAAFKMRSRETYCGHFDIVLPRPIDTDELRRFYDDDDGAFGLFFDAGAFFVDGFENPEFATQLGALVDELDRKRAACVSVTIRFDTLSTIKRRFRNPTLAQAGAWTDQAGASSAEAFTDALSTFDGDDSYAVTSAAGGTGTTVGSNDLVLQQRVFEAGRLPLRIERVRVRVRAKRTTGAGSDPQMAVVIGDGSSNIRSAPQTVSNTIYREHLYIFDQNPATGSAWTPAEITGGLNVGVANVVASATEPLRVSELYVEVTADYDDD